MKKLSTVAVFILILKTYKIENVTENVTEVNFACG